MMSRERMRLFSRLKCLIVGIFFSLGFFTQSFAEEISLDFSVLDEVKQILMDTKQYQEKVTPDGYVDLVYDIKEIPEEIVSYQDKEVLMSGYIISGGELIGDFYQYLLAKYPWDWCCQGVPPTLFTSIILKTKTQLNSVDRYAKVSCKGVFKMEVIENEGGIIGMFSLQGDLLETPSFQLMPVHYVLIGFIGLFFIGIISMLGIRFFQIKQKKISEKGNQKELVMCRGLTIGYKKKRILSSIDLTIKKGDLWGIIGPNGAGKTTLIRTIMEIIAPLEGRVSVKQNLKIGYVMQRQFLDDMYPFSVFELVMMGRYHLLRSPKRPTKQDIDNVNDALKLTGILDLKDQCVRDLSGGQKQRALIARALSAAPELLILDEPTNDMDLNGEDAVLSLIKKIHKETKTAVIIVSHLLPVVLNIAEEILFIKRNDQFDICKRDDLVSSNHLQDFYNLPVKVIQKGTHYSVVMDQ